MNHLKTHQMDNTRSRRRGGRRRGPGAGEHFGPDFGSGMPGHQRRGRGGGRGRGGPGRGRGRRGEVRNAVLALLAEEPRNGYQLMSEISERSQGLWHPSAGSIYPALGLLEDEGLIAPVDEGTGKTFRLTESGQAYVAERGEELHEPWAKVAAPLQGFLDVRTEMTQLGLALKQVVIAGDPAQVAAAKEIVDEARRALYRVLAEEQPSQES